jgi:GMP synthase (glutamine-hydrolysing) A subunit
LADLSFKPKGIILSGGPYSVYEDHAPHFDPTFFELPDTPILGICFGLQAIAFRLSDTNVIAGAEREYGQADVLVQRHGTNVDRLFEGLGDTMRVYMSHADRLSELPDGFLTLAKTEHSPFAGIAHATKPIYAIQFHPEVTHTPRGSELLRNFAVEICNGKFKTKLCQLSKVTYPISQAKLVYVQVLRAGNRSHSEACWSQSSSHWSCLCMYLLIVSIANRTKRMLTASGWGR